jgi:hypothetical protein
LRAQSGEGRQNILCAMLAAALLVGEGCCVASPLDGCAGGRRL